MNNAQFIKVIRAAMPTYMKEFTAFGDAYMCHAIENTAGLSNWQKKEAQLQIRNMMENKTLTLAGYLTKWHGVNIAYNYEATFAFYQIMLEYYLTFGDLLPSRLIVQQMQIKYPEWFAE